ncbi:hypothetical protein L6164_027394 [Bauhinia variegata]|uniref:Uncharacterized protein n=1 Tax=Bauhinia variegata TaxID=167791 RepID=A0ACB9LT19_BAUVA|nr:hypothetical protein L6164_027394 [Bauhinia variegata]
MSYLQVPSLPQSPTPPLPLSPPPPTTAAETSSHPSPLLVAFTLVILICFFMGFCLIYFCKCCISGILHGWEFQGGGSGSLVGRSGEESPNRGLDESLLKNFPTFSYSSVKEYRKEKYGLECAICLVEFEEESWLRLITTCYHVFHKECIDLWLMSHKTCPVCRRDLDSPPQKYSPDHTHTSNNESFAEEDVRIDVKEGEDASDHGDNNVGVEKHELVSQLPQRRDLEKFSRSHSTGHSIVLLREGEEENGGGGRGHEEEEAGDKYTLRLPDHVRIKLIRGHQYAKSCVTYGESTKRGACGNCGFVEGVSASNSQRAVVKAI